MRRGNQLPSRGPLEWPDALQVLRGRALLGTTAAVIRYYITDRQQMGGSIDRLLDAIGRNAQAGVDYIQLREKDLGGRELLELTVAALDRIHGTAARLLVNERTDIALAAGAHGVHLRSHSITPAEWRRIVPPGFLV